MSIDSTSSSTYHKKTLKSTLSQSDNYSYSRNSLKNPAKQSISNSHTMPIAEDNSINISTDLSSIPYIPYKQFDNKRNRRFSELKPTLSQGTNSERRNSIPQLSFSSLLPNAFRSNKHQHKTSNKDELNTSIDTSNNNYSLSFNDTMATKTEPLSSSKTLNSSSNGSRTNLSISNDTLSSISHEDLISSQFIFDPIYSEPRSANTFNFELNTSLCVAELYHKEFFEYFHTNYCGEFQQEGPFIVSLRYFNTNSNCIARAIIRIPNRNYDVFTTIDGTNDDNILQFLFNKVHLSAIQSYKSASDPKANEKIYLFDKLNDERQNCKIGFIYQRTDQRNETDIFNNDSISNEMFDFLQILGERVRLKGFDKYRGDLDVKNDLHGEYSYYTQYDNHEIMFNIAPMIPSLNTNGQCVKRKGLVGNSFVCIVFQETDAEFIPDFISGKVIQIYITVQPLKLNQKTYYKIGIWHRHDLRLVIDPPGGIYECDKSFRDYFLTLLLNSIHIAIQSPSLRYCIIEQRQRLKYEEIKKLSQILCTGPIFDTKFNVENNNNNHKDTIINSTILTTNENGIQNHDRISPAPTKKRTLSKIFGVFSSNRSTSVSIPTNDTPSSPLSSTEVNNIQNRTIQTKTKEPIKRAASVKHRPAPSPPIPPRIPISYMRSLASTHSSTLPNPSRHSSVSNSIDSVNDNTPLQNFSTLEEPVRSRSNSSPGDNVNTTTKRPLSTVSNTSKEISDASSSIDDYSESDSSEDEKYEHRPTLTESSIILPTNTNS